MITIFIFDENQQFLIHLEVAVDGRSGQVRAVSVHTKPEKFENKTVTGHFGFVYVEESHGL